MHGKERKGTVTEMDQISSRFAGSFMNTDTRQIVAKSWNFAHDLRGEEVKKKGGKSNEADTKSSRRDTTQLGYRYNHASLRPDGIKMTRKPALK